MSLTTKERIFDVAGPVFAEKGFQSTTVRELCDKAGVNVASINYYFGDKQNLYTELVRHAQQRCEAQHPLPRWSADTPGEQRLQDLVRTLLLQLSVAETAPWEVQLLMREVLYPSQGGAQVAEEYFSSFFKALLEVIERIAAQGLDRQQLTDLGIGVLSQCLIYRYAQKTIQQIAPSAVGQNGVADIDFLTRKICDFSLAAIAVVEGAETGSARGASLQLTAN